VPTAVPGGTIVSMKRYLAAGFAVLVYVALGVAGAALRGGVDPAIAGAGTTPKTSIAPSGPAAGDVCPPGSGKHAVTVRGEIVDYYCYIEKGLTGPQHKECGLKCVAGDVCMGILTEKGDLYMLSIDHIRAMAPLTFQGVPDPFKKCMSRVSEHVEIRGSLMERKGQRILEVAAVRKI
jgi:hypothetical protein